MGRLSRFLGSGVVLFAVAHCSLLVDTVHSELRCEQEGTIGAPACDPGQVCGRGRCLACITVEVCDDGVDNDCDGRVDQSCHGAGIGGAGIGGAGIGASGEGNAGAGGVTGAAGSDSDSN